MSAITELARLGDDWGPRALWDNWVLGSMLNHVGDVVEATYLPLLRTMADDPQVVEKGYADVVSRREPATRTDSPRTQWRKRYGNYVRELEWALGELAAALPRPQYEELVTRTISDRLGSWIGFMKPAMARGRQSGLMDTAVSGRIMDIAVSLSSFLVGPIEHRGDEDGSEVFYIPECAMHTVVGTGLAQEQACMQACKGACERLFGPDDPMQIMFDPHLPGLDCTMRVRLA